MIKDALSKGEILIKCSYKDSLTHFWSGNYSSVQLPDSNFQLYTGVNESPLFRLWGMKED